MVRYQVHAFYKHPVLVCTLLKCILLSFIATLELLVVVELANTVYFTYTLVERERLETLQMLQHLK